MKKGKLWAIVVLCSFFTQQIFAYSWETIGTNIEIVHEQEEIFEPIEIIELQDIVPEGPIEEVILDEEIILSESWSTEIIEQEENIWEDTESEFWEWDQIEIIEDKTISQSGWIIPETESKNNFNFWIKFQNPSYILEKDIEKTEYICNSDKKKNVK